VESELAVVESPLACTEIQDSVPRYLGQQTSSLPASSGVDQNDTAFCNTVAMGESGFSAAKKILPKHESTADSVGPKTVSAALFAQYDREDPLRIPQKCDNILC
jgi:hypothetical protein